jgi:hypothetical protein
VDDKGDTALHLAVRADHADVITLLLQAGADHSILNQEQMAPLHLACDLGHFESVKVRCFLLTPPMVLASHHHHHHHHHHHRHHHHHHHYHHHHHHLYVYFRPC